MQAKPRILLAAVDLSEASVGVLDTAVELLVDRPGSTLHVVHVSALDPTALWVMSAQLAVAPPDPDKVMAELRPFVDRALESARRAHPEARLHATAHVAWGLPVDEIVWLAAHVDADAVIVGTHGRRGVKRVLIGSVAERVVRLAGCQVLVAREKHHVASWKLPEIVVDCADCAALRAKSQGRELRCPSHAATIARSDIA